MRFQATQKALLSILFLFLFLSPLSMDWTAQAQLDGPSTGSCSKVTQALAGNTRTWYVRADGSTSQDCQLGTVVDFGAGSSLTLVCFETVGGVPPLQATTLTIRMVEDDTDFGLASPTPIRSINPSGNNCTEAGGESLSVACTTNGVAGGGSPLYGIIRIHIRAQETTPGVAYDVHSENGNALSFHGIFRCTPSIVALGESNPQSIYVAGDTIGTTITSEQQADNTNSGNFWVTCGSVSYNLGNSFPSSTAKSLTTTIVGSLNLWIDDCTNIRFGFTFTRFSAVTGFTTTPYAVWSGTAPSGVTYVDGNATFTSTKSLDRTVTTNAACEYHVNATAGAVTDFERLEGVTSHCHSGWDQARGTDIGNNVAARGFLTRSNPPDVGDYTSTDFLTGAGGSTSYTKASVITATPGTYHGAIQTFSTTARTEAVLLSIGNVTETFTLTSTRAFTNIFASVTSGGSNTSSFVLANDQQFQSARGLKNVRNELLSNVAVTCQRTKPDDTIETAMPMGVTDASGNTAYVEFQVVAPAGQWETTCTSTAAGNTASYTIVYFHISPFTADTNVVIEWLTNSTHLTITSGIHSVRVLPDLGIEQDFIDDTNDFKFELVARACDGCSWYPIASGLLNQSDSLPYWQANVTLPANVSELSAMHIHTWANFTGRMFLGTSQVHVRHAGTFTGNFTGNFTGANNTIPSLNEVKDVNQTGGKVGFEDPFLWSVTSGTGTRCLADCTIIESTPTVERSITDKKDFDDSDSTGLKLQLVPAVVGDPDCALNETIFSSSALAMGRYAFYAANFTPISMTGTEFRLLATLDANVTSPGTVCLVTFWIADDFGTLIPIDARLMTAGANTVTGTLPAASRGGVGLFMWRTSGTDQVTVTFNEWELRTLGAGGENSFGLVGDFTDTNPDTIGSNGNFSGNFTGNVSFLELNGMIDINGTAGIAALLWAALGFVLLSMRLYMPIMAVVIELLNIAFREAGQDQLWGWHFSVLITMGLTIFHILLFRVPEWLGNRGEPRRGER